MTDGTTSTTETESSPTPTTDGGDNGAGALEAPAAVDTSGQADDTTVLGSATAEEGAGGPEADSEAPATPTPVPDDAGVPDAYELKAFTVGEGDDETEVQIDSSLLDSVSPGLKEAGVTQAQLDKLAPLVPSIQEAALKNMNDEFSKTRADWAKEAREDPEIGGKNWDETVRLAGKALDAFGARSEIKDGVETNEFRKLLNDSGMGNHPVFIRMFRNIGAAASEDGTLIRNTSQVETKLTREQKNYPEDQPKA